MSRLENKVASIAGGFGGMGETHARRFVKLDVTNEEEWANTVKPAEEKFGPVEILVNNAGIAPGDSMKDLDVDLYRKVIEINQDGTV